MSTTISSCSTNNNKNNTNNNTTNNNFLNLAKKMSILRTNNTSNETSNNNDGNDGNDGDNSIHSTSSTISVQTSSSSRSVSFDKVEIREYSITVGDNPGCSSGPPLTLGWTYYTNTNTNITADVTDTGNNLKSPHSYSHPLDEYEQYRDGQRRVLHEMKVPARIRYDILREWDVPTSAILNAERECAEIQKSRLRTLEKVERLSCMKKLFSCNFRRMVKRRTGQQKKHQQKQQQQQQQQQQ